ncbi:hypothetical protein CXB51_026152 [Gossypium anomalum]|uniref:HAT C-terminal dimerisation domain-containing protein n=1 Tax=Gossypium anomalum TaxID=47600 RepID=A0A8J5YB39_9ROSI|nr:hypothetical protein CXB51_026152 [Gossypium anomalum]
MRIESIENSYLIRRKDQDIINAILLVSISEKLLQKLQEDGWTSLFLEVSFFCQKNDIDVPNIDDDFVAKGKSWRKSHKLSHTYDYSVELFYIKLIHLGKIYSSSFSPLEFLALDNQLEILVKLASIFPFATSNVERIFSIMKIVKNRLRN